MLELPSLPRLAVLHGGSWLIPHSLLSHAVLRVSPRNPKTLCGRCLVNHPSNGSAAAQHTGLCDPRSCSPASASKLLHAHPVIPHLGYLTGTMSAHEKENHIALR
jgi:hypothetical protein